MKAVELAVLDNLHRSCSRDSLPPYVLFFESDIRDPRTVELAVRGCDVVFHLAAQSNVMNAIADPGYAFSTNVIGTYNVLRATARAGAKRVVFTSSREVYGDPKRIPVRESAPLQAKNAYGASKIAGEAYCQLAAREGLETAVLRLTNVYGPGDQDRVIPQFVAAAAAGDPITVFGNEKVLDFVWIDTVVHALTRVGFGQYVRGPVNVGSGKGTALVDLARRIVKLTKSASPVRIQNERDHEVSRFVADIARGKRELGIPQPKDPLWALPRLLRGLGLGR
jgi:UDP-glucose 4-epimerase